jgi:hypothetical protein
MKIIGALVEWYRLGKTKVLGENLSECLFVQHKYNADWPEIKTGFLPW